MFATLLRVLRVDSKDVAQRRQSFLVQILVLALAAVEYVRIIVALITGSSFMPVTSLLLQLMAITATATASIILVRRNRPILAAHVFFLGFNLSLFGLIIVSGTIIGGYPYLFLISIVTIAVLDSVRMSLVYTAVIVTAVSIFTYLTNNDNGVLLNLLLTTISISITAWLTASNLHLALDEGRRLNRSIEDQAKATYRRARQLQLSAEVSQMTSQSLNPDKLLRDTVYLIRDQFNFYHVSIFLVSSDGQNLQLTEATGRIGDTLKSQKYQLPIAAEAVISWAARNRKARIINDVERADLYFQEPLLTETRSEMALPLVARGQLLGILDVQSQTTNAFSEDDIAILQIMANQIAVNIDNARLFAKTERQLSETETLFNVNRLLTTSMDPGEIYRRAARAMSRELPAMACVMSSWDPAAKTITTQTEYVSQLSGNQFSQVHTTQAVLPIETLDAVRRAVETSTPVSEHLNEKAGFVPDGVRWQTAVCLHVPLLRGNELIGIAHLFRTEESGGFLPDEIKLAQTLANETAVAVENALLATESQARVAQLSMLNRISTILSLSPTLRDVFDGARREILSLVEATGMSIMLLTPDKSHLNWAYGFEYGQEVGLANLPSLPITQGFSGHVIRENDILHVNSQLPQARREFESITVGAAASSWLGLPMIVTNETIGVLAVENAEDPDAFSDRDVALLKTIVGPLAITINNLLQLERVRAARDAQSQQRLQLQTAAEVAATAASALDLEELLQRTVTLIQERFALYYVGLFLIDEVGETAVLRAATGTAGQIQLENRHALSVGSQSLIGGATADGKPRITQDVTQDSEWRPNPHLPDTRSELALPLRVRGQLIGALTVQSTQSAFFSDELISTLQTMGDQLAIAIDNVRLISKTEARANAQRRLNEISARMHRSASVEEIVQIGLQALSEQLNDTPAAIQIGKPTRRPAAPS